MLQTVTTVEARDQFSRLVNRVGYGSERLVITRRGVKLAALIPFQEFITMIEKAPEEDWVDRFDAAHNFGEDD